MIYLYGKDGHVSKYENFSIPIILKYSVYKLGKAGSEKERHCMYVACCTWKYAEDWIRRNEYVAFDESRNSYCRYPYHCVRDTGEDLAYDVRTPIRVNPDSSVDYHLYYDGKNNVEPHMDVYEWEDKTGLAMEY